MHAFRAPAAGSGKSYLVDVASAIATGRLCPVIAAGRTEEETEKRLGGAMLLGYPLISIDNLNGELGGDCLCQLVERRIVSVRALGSSRLYQIENHSTVFANGNNIQPTGDIVRRVIMCSLDPNMERPEQRKFHGDPIAAVQADRGKYIAAAMTIVRAYLNSGQSDLVKPLASFEEWSRVVRSPLVWLGKEDPVSTMEIAREEDGDLQTLRSVVAAWKEAAGFNNPMSTGRLKAFAEECEITAEGDYHQRHCKILLRPDFHQAILDIASRSGEIDAKRLGCYLSRHQHRVVDGVKIMAEEDSHKKQKLWWLKNISDQKGEEDD
jgi:putative DNA primase/helicase